MDGPSPISQCERIYFRKKLLTFVVQVPICVLAMLPAFGQTDAASGKEGLSSRQSIDNKKDLRQLARILADAGRNVLIHDTPNAGLETKDLFLESASIRFASRMLYEITEGSCQRDEHAAARGASADPTCVLDDESIGLNDLTDMLSYAAHQLEELGRPAPAADGLAALVAARLGSMEHLYRMIFALSRIYLDRSQSGVYAEAAHEQLTLARRQIETERSLCAWDGHEHTARLLELSEVEDRLDDMQDDAARA